MSGGTLLSNGINVAILPVSCGFDPCVFPFYVKQIGFEHRAVCHSWIHITTNSLPTILARPGMEWLLSPNDPYFDLAMGIARTDWHILPNADCIVTFVVEPADWRAMLERRNRALDRDEAFSKSYETQRYFIDAAIQLAAERNINIAHFRQTFGTVQHAAERLHALLREAGILP